MQKRHPDISEVKRLFDGWRRQKRHLRERIPESLLQAAAGLCASHPMTTVSQELGIDRKKLRKVAGLTGKRRQIRSKRSKNFVSLALNSDVQEYGSSAAIYGSDSVNCEWLRPRDGACMRLSICRKDIALVMHAFLGGAGGGQ